MERPLELVRQDLRNGYITLEQANRYYGLDNRSKEGKWPVSAGGAGIEDEAFTSVFRWGQEWTGTRVVGNKHALLYNNKVLGWAFPLGSDQVKKVWATPQRPIGQGLIR
jgi:hypothetical protein